jgi:hypothetical protein
MTWFKATHVPETVLFQKGDLVTYTGIVSSLCNKNGVVKKLVRNGWVEVDIEGRRVLCAQDNLKKGVSA